jgi:hypothetical protein
VQEGEQNWGEGRATAIAQTWAHGDAGNDAETRGGDVR